MCVRIIEEPYSLACLKVHISCVFVDYGNLINWIDTYSNWYLNHIWNIYQFTYQIWSLKWQTLYKCFQKVQEFVHAFLHPPICEGLMWTIMGV
jgi:hypothetical protein